MKLPDLPMKEYKYLPTELMNDFSKSYSRSFPEVKLNSTSILSFLNRKFQRLSEGRFHNISALITMDGRVASGYGIIRNKYSNYGKEISVGLICDVFTDPDFRKMGLFKKVSLLAIKRESLSETKFLIGFPIRNEVMPGHLSVGWRYIFDMHIWWAFPRIGSYKNISKNPDLDATMFSAQDRKISILPSSEYLDWRFSLFEVDYYLIRVSNSADFAIVRKSRIKRLPFTCIIFIQTTSIENSRNIVNKIRNFSLRLGTLGVIGCWNDSYADDLFLKTSGLNQSTKVQKVIIRELNSFECPNDECEYRLSWLDSDTL